MEFFFHLGRSFSIMEAFFQAVVERAPTNINQKENPGIGHKHAYLGRGKGEVRKNTSYSTNTFSNIQTGTGRKVKYQQVDLNFRPFSSQL